jgi:peptidoglycan endopeptidase LytE
MSIKKIFQLIILSALIFASLATTGSAFAWSGCGTSYIVQQGDTLGTIANRCGTSVAALQLANPNMGYWIYAGQTLWLPGAFIDNGNGYATYIVARGDTLKILASRFGTSVDFLSNLNGIYNINLIYEGQRLAVPSGYAVPSPVPSPQPSPSPSGTYVVQWGDTLRRIADRMNINVNDLIAVNPQLWNPNLIFIGQVINIPASASLYTIQHGDTLKIIAARFGTTVDNLLALNPQIWNENLIYAGQVIRVW